MNNLAKIALFFTSDDCYKHCSKALDKFSTDSYNDIEKLVSSIQKEPVDIILMELVKGIIESDIEKFIEQIKTNNEQPIHIIFITSDQQQESFLENMDYFPMSSITHPYSYQILENHVQKIYGNKKLIQQANVTKNELDDVQQELDDITNAMLVLQNDNAKLMDINRFLQHSFFCPDIQSLCEQLFSVLHSFGTSATIYIHSDKHDEFIADNTNKKINKDILLLLKDEKRIFQFGNDRAVFNWDSASLLVTKVGDDIDNIAMLMDGFEIGFNAITSVEEFNVVLNSYRKENQKLNTDVTKVVEDLATGISGKLAEFGTETSLTIEQEEELLGLAEHSVVRVDQLFEESLKVDEELNKVMDKMRTDKEEASSSTVEEDTIDFF